MIIKSMSEIFEIQSSKRVHKSDWKPKGIPFYRAREVVKLANNENIVSPLFISKELFSSLTSEKGYPKYGDLLVSAVGTLGACYRIKRDDLFYFKDASVLWFKNISGINSKYVEYMMMSNSMKRQIHLNSVGATVGTLTIKRAKELTLPIPELLEQNKIVAKLDQAFEAIDQAIANTEKNIENLDELERGYLNGIFDTVSTESVLKYLPEISENLDRQRIPITKRDRVNGEIPYYGASGIVDYVSDHLFDERLLCISEDGANLLARKYPIAFQISGKTWVNNHAHVLRFKDIHLERFVMHYLNHIKLDSFISGMAQPKLNQAKLNKIPIPIPKIRKVEEICLKIERLNVLTSEMRMVQTEKLESMKQLKMSILEKAFKGELV